MKRRDFFKKTWPATVLPFVVNGLPVSAVSASPLIEFLAKAGSNEDHVLVLIQLSGGNDGLNTVIPLDQYSNLSNARSNILIAQNKVLSLSGTNATGLHPAMSEVRSMYDNGYVSIVQGVGYPNPDFSHFRATDIWLSASDSNQYLESGWLGRFLDQEYPNFPNGYPNTTMPDPLAIQVGSVVSPALQGPSVSMGMAITDPKSFYNFLSGTVDPAPNTPAGHELTFIRLVSQQTQSYSTVIKAAASKATNKSTLYPATGKNPLADQLKIVAQLVAGGLKTKVYMVSLGGFDNHSAQVDSSATETGVHASLLQKISEAVNAFQDDLKLLNADDRVLTMTFSEFGRRIRSNASLGTDHGSAAPVLLFGKHVKPGIIGSNPIIPATVSVNDNVPMQYDFRSVYTSILKDWFGVPQSELDAVMLQQFTLLPITTTGMVEPELLQAASVSNYPNPCTDYTQISFTTQGGLLRIRLFDNMGREMQTVAEGNYPKGRFNIMLPTSNLPGGIYYYQVQQGSQQVMKSLVITR